MNYKKVYLKPGDLVITDNVISMFNGKKCNLTDDSLASAEKYILDKKTKQKCPIEHEVTKDDIKLYYTRRTLTKTDKKELLDQGVCYYCEKHTIVEGIHVLQCINCGMEIRK